MQQTPPEIFVETQERTVRYNLMQPKKSSHQSYHLCKILIGINVFRFTEIHFNFSNLNLFFLDNF